MSVLAAVEGEAAHHLPMAPIWYGVIAAVIFAALLAITFAYRSAANRHNPEAFVPHGATTQNQGEAGHGSGGH